MGEKPSRIVLTLKSAPFASQPEDADRFYAAVGRFLMLWGHLEFNLDGALSIIARLSGWPPLSWRIEEDVPTSMRLKKEMWSDAFKRLAALQAQREKALTLMSAIMELNDERAMIVHGRWNGFVSADPLTLEIAHTKRKKAKKSTRHYRVEIKAIESMADDADRLNMRLCLLTYAFAPLSAAASSR